MKTPRTLTALLLWLAACNPEDQDIGGVAESAHPEESEEGEQAPELPCGDVNLWTDDMNCGACGHECNIMWPGTDYETGHCVEGKCGPIWSPIFTYNPQVSCVQLCSTSGCAPMECSGLSAIICVDEEDGLPGDSCDLIDPSKHAHMELTSSCGENLPDPTQFYPNDLEQGADLFVRCCCDRLYP